MRFNTPLRYPGGKGRLSGYFQRVLDLNGIVEGTYVEPFAGGAGTAMNLLLGDKVSNVVINDADKSIFYFWKAITEHNEEFIEQLNAIEASMPEWERQKERQKSSNVLERGFSTFYLNRTNRSGILDGGAIGGRDQKGNYKIDARYNKFELKRRIEEIGNKADKIKVYGMDAQHLLKTILPDYDVDKTLVYIDPPYYVQGSNLYMNFYGDEDHIKLSETIKELKHKWILSYDNVKPIRDIYFWKTPIEFNLNYSMYESRDGPEVFYSNGLELPEGDIITKARREEHVFAVNPCENIS